jgi:hypothetical protein
MLPRALALHNPNCRGACAPGDCVQDLEAFCGSIRAAHFQIGAKRGDGSIDGQLSLSSADADDVLAFLVSRAWELSRSFNAVSDSRGLTRLAGYLSQRLHWAATDWTRKRFGSTRYGPVAVFTPTADPEVHVTETRLDTPYEGDYEDVLDLDMPGLREAVELLRPLLDDETVTITQAAERSHVKPHEVARALTQVRAAARRQGLGAPDEERQALAEQAAELRKQRLTFHRSPTLSTSAPITLLELCSSTTTPSCSRCVPKRPGDRTASKPRRTSRDVACDLSSFAATFR